MDLPGFPIKVNVDTGNVSEAANNFIDKVSHHLEPRRIRKMADAETYASLVKATGNAAVAEIDQRAARRLIAEEVRHQENIESIVNKSVPVINPDGEPEKLDDDWLMHFFGKCRRVSNDEMQNLWAALLASEVNKPGTCSRHTVSVLESLDKGDALLLKKLCSFMWVVNSRPNPILLNQMEPMYINGGMTFSNVKHMHVLGLVSLTTPLQYTQELPAKNIFANYFDRQVTIDVPGSAPYGIYIGHVTLTRAGLFLAGLCASQPIDGFMNYVIEYWRSKGLIVEEIES